MSNNEINQYTEERSLQMQTVQQLEAIFNMMCWISYVENSLCWNCEKFC